jgi:transcriptional regulator with XRE-family HTH domain
MGRERKALIAAREARGLTRPEFARVMKGSRNFVHAVETGEKDPSLEYMQRWVKALGGDASLDLFVRRATKPHIRPRQPARDAAE